MISVRPPRYFHGGIRGLKVGDYLVPASEHGKLTLADYATAGPTNLARQQVLSRKYVFVTTVKKYALAYAMAYPGGGALYEVNPVGDLEADGDNPGVSFVCERACVIWVCDAMVTERPERSLRILAGHQAVSYLGGKPLSVEI